MKQLTEIRYNPLLIPQEKGEPKPVTELILVASRIGYEVGLDGTAKQVQESHVWRCMATPVAMANAALNLLHLLTPELRKRVLDSAAELDEPAA